MKINNGLVFSHFKLSLCTSEKEFKRELKELKLPKSVKIKFLSDGSDATTHFVGSSCFVCIKVKKRWGWSKSQIHCLLVHEAVHVWQESMAEINENNPSEEFEAYSIQQISQNLIDAYEESLNG